jgi:hypothetical protein
MVNLGPRDLFQIRWEGGVKGALAELDLLGSEVVEVLELASLEGFLKLVAGGVDNLRNFRDW